MERTNKRKSSDSLSELEKIIDYSKLRLSALNDFLR